MFETWAESRALQVAIKCPAIWQLVHLFATGTPMSKTAINTPHRATGLPHYQKSALLSKYIVACGGC